MSRGKLQVDEFKAIMGSYPTGVTVVTTFENDAPIGLTVNSFASVSLDPLMILWCIDKRSSNYNTFKNANNFAVNILAGDQKDECFTFASSKEKDRFSKTAWEYSANKLPIIQDVFGVFECKTVQTVEAGDHLILIGEVFNIIKNKKDPMLYYRRNVGFIPDDWNA